MFSAIKAYFGHLLEVPDAVSPARYRSLRRIMTILMVTVSVTPLLILTGINHAQYMSTLEREMENPLYAMVRKSQASLELFLGERASTVSLIAHAYSFDDLTNEQTLNRVFLALKSEFQGFVDMGLVDVNGRQVAYVGPYKLKDADYAGQPWLSEAQVKGRYISDVFLGLRGFPHMVIAVHRMEESGREWTLRVTIDTSRLERLVAAVGLMQDTDAFLCDSRGVLQTNSRFYGKVLDKLPLTLPPQSFETTVRPWKDDSGQDLMVAYTSLAGTDFMLLAVKPTLDIYKPWTALRSELLLVFCGGIAIIVLVSHLLMKHLVGRLQASDERRVAVFAQMEHNQKLSSIGRLAAGVAHEVNNPLAVINEKAGLGLDLLHMSGNFERKDRLISLLEAIESTVERARGITHRLLGFARRGAGSGTLWLDQLCAHYGAMERDVTPPVINIQSTEGTLQASVTDDSGSLSSTGITVAIDGAAAAFQYSGGVLTCALPTDGARHRITVTARDAMGNLSRQSTEIGQAAAPSFSDMNGHWAAAAVEYLHGKGVFSDAEQFRPGDQVNNAMAATMLSRYLGVDVTQYENTVLPYTDAAKIPDWALPHVKAMYALGMMKGSTDAAGRSVLNPGAACSRAQIMTMLGRTLTRGYAYAPCTYADAGQIPAWSRDHLDLLSALGIVNGNEKNQVNPNGTITRAEFAALLYRMY